MGAFSTGYRNIAYIADSGHGGFKINKILFSHLQKLMVERVMDGLGVDPSVNLRLWPLARVCVLFYRGHPRGTVTKPEIFWETLGNRASITVYQAGTQYANVNRDT